MGALIDYLDVGSLRALSRSRRRQMTD